MADIIARSTESSAHYVDLYDSGNKIHTRSVKGIYQRLHRFINAPLIAAFLIIPWLQINGRPAILLDISSQKFHVFWSTYWPQDGIMLAWLLMISAFLLFTVTVLVGRVWCGFTCPQTVWTLIFMWVEEKCEGNRNHRIKLDEQKATFEKVIRKSAKHVIWLFISLITSLTFVGYFYGIRPLIEELLTLVAPLTAYFWVSLFLIFTYVNAGWLREQVCKYMCPYARFQSVMFDDQTMLVTYDAARGETRGARKMGSDHKAEGLGDCVDCDWCVQVCPAGIDIREGLQAECINCGLCVDACNNVMDKMGYARSLISFTNSQILGGEKPRIWRPRLVGYLAFSFIIIALLGSMAGNRTPLSVDVARDRGTHLYRERNNNIENVYTVKINNMGQDTNEYQISLQGNVSYTLKGMTRVTLEKGEVFTLPIRVKLPREDVEQAKDNIAIVVSSLADPNIRAHQTTSFIAPLP